MTARNPGPGGRIPPDGRQARPPGVGPNARRHDLEQPATPGLHGSDLQQGDVQMLEAGQQVVPIGGKRTQRPNPGRNVPSGGGGQQGGGYSMNVPDPMAYAKQRLGGTFSGATGSPGTNQVSFEQWRPLLERLVTNPNVGGALAQAYIVQLGNLMRRGRGTQTYILNYDDLDRGIEEGLR